MWKWIAERYTEAFPKKTQEKMALKKIQGDSPFVIRGPGLMALAPKAEIAKTVWPIWASLALKILSLLLSWQYPWTVELYQLGAISSTLSIADYWNKITDWITYERPNSSANIWFHDKITTLDKIAWAQIALLSAVLINVSTDQDSNTRDQDQGNNPQDYCLETRQCLETSHWWCKALHLSLL